MESRVLMRDGLLRTCVKKWFSFQYALQNLGVEESKSEYESLMSSLKEYEYSVERAEDVTQRNTHQLEYNEKLLQEKREEVAKLTRERDELKQKFKQAKQAKAEHEEFEKLSDLINRYPSRQETEQTVKKLQDEISELEQEKKETEDKIAAKNNQFQLLLYAIHSLQQQQQQQQQSNASKKETRQQQPQQPQPQQQGEGVIPMELEDGEV